LFFKSPVAINFIQEKPSAAENKMIDVIIEPNSNENSTKISEEYSETNSEIHFIQLPENNSVSSRTSICESHNEPHFASAEIIRDIIIGLSDGLTVPFALAAGLATLNDTRLVVTAGAAEVVAGSLSMALGGYLAGLSEIEHYDSERKRELWEIEHVPEREESETYEIFEPYGIHKEELEPLMNSFRQNKESWVRILLTLMNRLTL
jgi:hypothetical protein